MFDPNSRALVYGQGYVKLSELTGESRIWTGEAPADGKIASKDSECVAVTLISGATLICSPKTKLLTMAKRLEGVSYVKAVDLSEKHLVYLCGKSPDFECLDLSKYKFLSKLKPYEIGVLAGLFSRAAGGPHGIDVAKSRKELNAVIPVILDKLGVEWTSEEYESRTIRVEYKIEEEEFFTELRDFLVCFAFPKPFWKSKSLLEGFLKVFFTFGSFGGEMLIVKDAKDSSLLNDVQQALLLFGVNSAYIGGLRISKLIVSKNNAYRFAHDVGIYNPEQLFGPLDYTRFLEYNKKDYSDSKYERVAAVKMLTGTRSCIKPTHKDIMLNGMIIRSL